MWQSFLSAFKQFPNIKWVTNVNPFSSSKQILPTNTHTYIYTSSLPSSVVNVVQFDCPPTWSLLELRPILDLIILVQCGQWNAVVVGLGWTSFLVALFRKPYWHSWGGREFHHQWLSLMMKLNGMVHIFHSDVVNGEVEGWDKRTAVWWRLVEVLSQSLFLG